MVEPKVEWTDTFQRQLRKLCRKDQVLKDRVIDLLHDLAQDKVVKGNRLGIGSDKHVVFKVRVALGNRGKRSGARVIYLRTSNYLIALFIYSKKDSEPSINKILQACEQAAT